MGNGEAFTQLVKMIVPLLARMRNQYCVLAVRPVCGERGDVSCNGHGGETLGKERIGRALDGKPGFISTGVITPNQNHRARSVFDPRR